METPDAENIRVRSLTIVDKDGKAIGYVGPNNEGQVNILLFDRTGTIRVSASVCADEHGEWPMLGLHDQDGRVQVANVLAPGKEPPVPPLLDNRFCKFE